MATQGISSYGTDSKNAGLMRQKVIIQAPKESLRLCAKHAQVDEGRVQVLQSSVVGRNWVFVVRADLGTSNDCINYFIRVRAASSRPEYWRVDRDFMGLTYVKEHVPRNAEYCCIEPVGFEVTPERFLVTRYQPGTTLDQLLRGAIRKGRCIEQAMQYSARMGRWLAAFRQSGRQGSDETGRVDAAVEAAMACFSKLGRYSVFARRNESDQLLNELRYWVQVELISQMNDLPTHGDFKPQNFILGEDGLIYPIDFSAFGFRQLDSDVFMFRVWIEKMAVLCGPKGRTRAGDLWQVFWDAHINAGEPPVPGLVSYLTQIPIQLSAVSLSFRHCRSLRSIGRYCRDHLWRQQRLRWLSNLPQTGPEILDYFRRVL